MSEVNWVKFDRALPIESAPVAPISLALFKIKYYVIIDFDKIYSFMIWL